MPLTPSGVVIGSYILLLWSAGIWGPLSYLSLIHISTPEAFISDQEQLLGRKLAENEREVIAAWVKVFNLFYEGGLKQDHAVLNRRCV